GETEVVADEAAPVRARIARPGARVLRQPAEVLPRLLGIPRKLGDAPVRPDGQGAAAAVVVGLERDINAEVRPPDVGRQDACVVGARLPAVVELDRDRPARTGGHVRPALAGEDACRVYVAVHPDSG